ncbi:MAG: FAD-binding oxidoreductase [Minisyncoccia bacterium]
MIPNHSPWIKQLNRTRPVVSLQNSLDTDFLIVGGGIAGVTTAYFALKNTDKNVVLIEADKIAHGATGHNAGQITSYFERPLTELVDEFGLELAISGQAAVESGWGILDEIVSEAKLQTPLYKFTGFAGFSGFDQVLQSLRNNRIRVQGGLQAESIYIAKEWIEFSKIPEEYKDLYQTISHKDLLDLLETSNTSYIALLAYQKGCMNSALYTEELIGYLISNYKDRFSFFEGSPLKKISLDENSGTVEVLTHTIKAERIVLCTNGFENFTIKNNAGPEIDTKFHHSLFGRICYMSGYIEPFNNPPIAISYFPKTKEIVNDPTGESYFLLTRRPHEHEGNKSHNLLCIGGPDRVLPNHAIYSRDDPYREDIQETIDDFLRENYSKYPTENNEYSFSWHGLMGYTPNGIRRVGIEPCNPVLLYNLGCNGVGILPSIFGAKRISRFLGGENVEKSIFDPEDFG